MARRRLTDKERLQTALEELHAVLGSEQGVVRGNQLSVGSRKWLQSKGFLREILRGWYFVSDPNAGEGDTTPFYANFWDYLARYLNERFGAAYCLSAEHSLLRHVQYNVIPATVNVWLAVQQSQVQQLAFGHSVNMFPGSVPDSHGITLINGLRCVALERALVTLPPRYFLVHPREIQIALSQLTDPAALAALVDVNRMGLERVLSACRYIGQSALVEAVLDQLRGFGLQLETNADPFADQPVYQLGKPGRAPLYARVNALWGQHRAAVLACKPAASVVQLQPAQYLAQMQAIKVEDAYHSLSIERYRVTPELILKVAEAGWDPMHDQGDRKQIDAMAAKGYLEAFALVTQSTLEAYTASQQGLNTAGTLIKHNHQAWFQRLFSPSVDAGILVRADLVGYRRNPVFLRGSLHSPPHCDSVRDGMEAWLDNLGTEPDAFVRAVLGHWLFGFIHPYMDGNGRMARFIMNVLLASGGYAWTVIRVEEREQYMQALEAASVGDALEPFARFIASGVERAALQFITAG